MEDSFIPRIPLDLFNGRTKSANRGSLRRSCKSTLYQGLETFAPSCLQCSCSDSSSSSAGNFAVGCTQLSTKYMYIRGTHAVCLIFG